MEITADKEKAEMFNKYFSSVFVTEDVTHMPDKLDVSASQFLENVNFSQDDILQLLLKINACKSPGPDNIHPRVLKECAAELSLPFGSRALSFSDPYIHFACLSVLPSVILSVRNFGAKYLGNEARWRDGYNGRPI